MAGLFPEVRPGDRIRVAWGDKVVERKYPSEGVVVQVTGRLIVFETAGGYRASVSAADVAAGAEVRVVRGRSAP